MSQQGQIAPSSPAAAAPTPPPKPTQPPASSLWSRLAIPMFAVIVALGFVALATQRFDEWVGNAVVQTTNDAYVRAELTRLASRVSGEVLTVGVTDFQRVKAGDLLIQIDPADYELWWNYRLRCPAAAARPARRSPAQCARRWRGSDRNWTAA
ncbi:multidrug resistance efflux pump [Bradyrhizobium sp. LM6.10]